MKRLPYLFLLLCLVSAEALAQTAAAPPAAAKKNPALAVLEASGLDAIPRPDNLPAALLDEALAVIIHAVVPGAERAVHWEAREFKYTVPGTTVSVRLLGNDVVVLVSITPYQASGENLLLVTQGQVWYKDEDGSVRLRTTFDTLNVVYGEKVFFYPLGVTDAGVTPLRIELMVNSYRILEAAQAELLAQQSAAGGQADPNRAP